VTWGGDWALQRTYTRADVTSRTWVKSDWSSSNYAGRCILFLIFGITDAMYQCYAYWVIGAISNDISKLAYLNGYYKGIRECGFQVILNCALTTDHTEAAGATIVWRLDALKVSYVRMYACSFAVLGAGLLIMLPMI
jgi:hypothetical protein